MGDFIYMDFTLLVLDSSLLNTPIHQQPESNKEAKTISNLIYLKSNWILQIHDRSIDKKKRKILK